jgi:hypothetical protein
MKTEILYSSNGNKYNGKLITTYSKRKLFHIIYYSFDMIIVTDMNNIIQPATYEMGYKEKIFEAIEFCN